ncbi:IS4 family transposase [Bradyrhizobium diazoefficiens]|uniref:IS4 family transposase n=1 Tax=Bradyrhizobium diazoefficiens TaxID=1355477 RepID=UPI00190ABCC7|nr:IS4 family transposase [Bradyrhizobium diazoefficiens]QQO14174.1 IS4 family transposase [Bradyrhizobium diazoefficiens]QQO14261.1 IS4 family transposase [Bradyrhizobium diazoefficiens]QQO14444.1 IS4 family transposase [Bradyrhizobium diazoefficiens]QQO14455.1 IS4 family transposase [Bradyrhizobium diazoefficiens]QQO15643.1 IS4 family transposase [Bradyrhizobium diazoefficiens]
MLQRAVERVTMNLRAAADGRAEWVGFSRWLNNPSVTVDEIAGHGAEVLSERVAGLHALAIQDTTELNYARHAGRVRGLGPSGNGIDPGLFVHPVLAVDAGSGALLGLAGMQIWTRRGPASPDYRNQPIEEKESYRWIKGAAGAKSALAAAAMITVIGDRESDIYEEFDRIPDARTHLLTRVCRDRALVGGGRLFDIAQNWPVQHRFDLEVRAQPGRPARTAKIALRFGEVTIKRPANCSDRKAAHQLTLRLVEVKELDPSVEEPIHWRLVTTHAVTTVEQALQIVAWYRQRWHIEQLFRTSKSQGLDIESSQVEAAEALFKLAAIAVMAAIKIMQLVLARDGTVDRPATDVVPADQLPILKTLQVKLEGKTVKQKNPHPEHSIAWLAWIIARLGGWTGYASERPPGPITMRRGWHRFEQMALGWRLREVCTP